MIIRVKLAAASSVAFAMALLGGLAFAQEGSEQPNPPRKDWSFAGIFGMYDQAQLQRGFQVYREVCSTCHALSIPFHRSRIPMARPLRRIR